MWKNSPFFPGLCNLYFEMDGVAWPLAGNLRRRAKVTIIWTPLEALPLPVAYSNSRRLVSDVWRLYSRDAASNGGVIFSHSLLEVDAQSCHYTLRWTNFGLTRGLDSCLLSTPAALLAASRFSFLSLPTLCHLNGVLPSHEPLFSSG